MKPMAKKTLIMKSSALCENIKVTALTQEVACLSKNTSMLVDTYKYKNLDATPPVVSVLFVPKTWGSVLQKRLQELEPM